MKNLTLTFTTYLPAYKDPITKKIVDDQVDALVEAVGRLQPFIPTGRMQVSVPSGFTLESSKFFSTRDKLPMIDDLNSVQSATTVLDGVTHYIAKEFPFTDTSNLSTARNFYILVRKSMREGSV